MPDIALSGNLLDRAHKQRLNAAWLAEARASMRARFLVLSEGKPLVQDGQAAILKSPALALIGAGDEPGLFLGLEGDTPYFGIHLSGAAAEAASRFGSFADFRSALTSLPQSHGAMLGTVRGLLNWHGRHRFCSNCGNPSTITDGGWKRVCPACEVEHFPRIDPVVIMLAIRGDYALMGRQSMYQPGVFSTLAGFMEPGETVEEAVAREIREESGVETGAVRYIASQPWPFPSSIMLGCHAEALSEAITVDHDELEDVRWFSRAEVAAALPRAIGEGPLSLPPRFAISHFLIRRWIEKG